MRFFASLLAATLLVASCGDTSGYTPAVPLDIYVDAMGVGHAFAKFDADAMYGAGYIVARDRLFQLELVRRRTHGTLCEVLGETSFDDDRIARLFNFTALGVADYELTQRERPDDVVLFRAFVGGINHRIDEIADGKVAIPYGFGPNELDFLPTHWQPEETFAVGKLLALGLSSSLDNELLASVLHAIAPGLGSDFPLFMPAFDSFIQAPPTNPGTGSKGSASVRPAPQPPTKAELQKAAALRDWVNTNKSIATRLAWRNHLPRSFSNNWAVDGKYTDNGRPFMAGDPHQGVSSPISMVPYHASASLYGGKLNVMGFTFPGAPIIAMGQNANLAWTSTVNFADVLDVYDVQDTLNAKMEPVVNLGGTVYPVTTRPEIIKVRTGGPGKTATYEERAFPVREVTDQGTFFPEEMLPVPKTFIANGSIFFRWIGSKPTRESLSYLDQNRATTLDEFDTAVKLTQVGAVNIVFADKTGIGFRAHGDVPDRGTPSRGMPWKIVSGDDPANFWTHGNLAEWQLPNLRNPDKGYIVTGNNDPFGFTSDGSVDDDPFYYGAFYAGSMRSHRAEQDLDALIASGKKITRADMETMQSDYHSVFADALVPALVDAVGAIGTDPTLDAWKGRDDLTAAAAKLAAWNRSMDATATEPIMFRAVQAYAVQRAFLDNLTSTLFDVVESAAPTFLPIFVHNLVTGRMPHPELYAPNGLRAFLVAALDDATMWSTGRFGSAWPDGHQWKELNFVAWVNSYGGRFNAKDGIGGGLDTLRPSEAAFLQGGVALTEFHTGVQPIFQMVYAFDDDGRPEQTLTIARGVDENPDSAHFADTDADWLAGVHKKAPFTLDEVMAEATEHIVLK